jgi:hypothetical protein
MAKEFVDRILKKLFGERVDSAADEIAPIKEKLVRSPKYMIQYDDWKSSQRFVDMLELLEASYSESILNPGGDTMQWHNSPQANGFFFDNRYEFKSVEFSYLMDYFRDQVLKEGYSTYLSDKKYLEKSESVQVIERHYLKPTLTKDIKVPIDQKYGNVLIEYVAYNDAPAYLKVMASCYSDRNYSKALDFSDLAESFFNPN